MRQVYRCLFFQVAAVNDPTADELRRLIADARQGEWNECNPLDGSEHSYIELGGWIGDQGLAMQFMGLCHLLGLGELITPNSIPGLDDDTKRMLAGSGMITLHAARSPEPAAA